MDGDLPTEGFHLISSCSGGAYTSEVMRPLEAIFCNNAANSTGVIVKGEHESGLFKEQFNFGILVPAFRPGYWRVHPRSVNGQPINT